MFATLNGLLTRQPFAVGGSGSSYVYGFVDAEYRRGMSKEESQQFVVNSKFIPCSFLGERESVSFICADCPDEPSIEKKCLVRKKLK